MIDLDWKDLWSLRLENPFEDAETLVLDDKGYIKSLTSKKPKDYNNIDRPAGLIKVSSNHVEKLMQHYETMREKALDT